MEEPKDAASCHLFDLYSLFADDIAESEIDAACRAGGFGYGDVKKALFRAAEEYFAPARERRAELAANMDQVHEILNDGASAARKKASEVLARAKKACGV